MSFVVFYQVNILMTALNFLLTLPVGFLNKPFKRKKNGQVLVTVCGIPNSAELGDRIQNSAEFTDPEVILWNPDAARAESADRGSF
jgi:hypothetical protein